MHHRLKRAALLISLAPALAMAVPAIAQADTLAITHDSDPVEQVPFRVNFPYSTNAGNEAVYATIKVAGGAGCGPNYNADQGSMIDYNDSMSGAGTDTVQITEPEGTYLICAYEQQTDGQLTPDATAQTTLTVRQIHATLQLSAPTTARVGVPFVLRANYTVEQPRYAYVSYAKVVPGTSCAQTYSLAPSAFASAIYGDSIAGAGSDPTNVTLTDNGTYLFCGWVQLNDGDADPAAVASTTVIVGRHASLPACVAQSRSVVAAERALARARRNERRHRTARNRRAVRVATRALGVAQVSLRRCRG